MAVVLTCGNPQGAIARRVPISETMRSGSDRVSSGTDFSL